MWLKEREGNINKMLSSLPKETEVIWDTDYNSCHTLQRVVDSNEAMLIMEDDIELCKNFYEKAKAEIYKRPDNLVMFYSCKTGEVIEAEHKEKGLPYDRPFIYTQAFYLPAGLGKKLKWFLSTNFNANRHRYSKGINEFVVLNNIPRYLVLPALVQHIWFESIGDKWKINVMHQSKTYKYDLDN